MQARAVAGGGFALAAPADVAAATRRILEQRLLLAVAAGVLGAALVGVLATRAASAPLRRTAAAARSLRLGARDVRVPVAGPQEVAELALSVNDLADALRRSESRQRTFLGSVSHELRTPLAGIAGRQALADGLIPAAEVAQVSLTITGARAVGCTGSSTTCSTWRAGRRRLPAGPRAHRRCGAGPRNGRGVAAAMRGTGRAARHRGGRLRRFVLVTDARRVRQVLDGLAENALRLLAPGRPLVLHAAAGADARGAVLQVRDGGPGLADDDLTVAFEPGRAHRALPRAATRGRRARPAAGTRPDHSTGGTIEAGRAPKAAWPSLSGCHRRQRGGQGERAGPDHPRGRLRDPTGTPVPGHHGPRRRPAPGASGLG